MTERVIRIASYNIRKARGLDQKRLPERTLNVINQLDADIVVLQEADKRMGARKPALPRELIARESDFKLVDVSANGISLGWHGNAVLLHRSWKVARTERLHLPGLEPRGAVRVDVDAGASLSIVAAHLGLLRRDRRAQLRALCNATDEFRHTVIAGDFNEWSTSRGLEPLMDRFETYAPGHSFHARRPVASLDRIALSKGLYLSDAGVEQGALARVASDHLPVWTDIALPRVPATC